MATRFYLPSSGDPSPALSPAYSTQWDDTSIGARLRTQTGKSGTGMTTVDFADADVTDKDILFRQYISDPIAANVSIATPTVKFQLRGSETSTLNNLFLAVHIRVVQADGTLRGTILDLGANVTELATTLVTRGNSLAPGTTVSALATDRIVIETGTQGDPSGTSHSSSLRIGDSDATDLPENDTETADNNPWVEISTNIPILGFGWDVLRVSSPPRRPQTNVGFYAADLSPIAPPPARQVPAEFGPRVIRVPNRIVSY